MRQHLCGGRARAGAHKPPDPCPTCHGTGKRPLRLQRMGGWWETIELRCEDCRGSGLFTDEATRRYLESAAQFPDDPF